MLERILNDTHARTSEPNSFSVGPVSVHALILPPSHHPLPVHHHAAGRSCSDAPCVPLPLILPPPSPSFPGAPQCLVAADRSGSGAAVRSAPPAPAVGTPAPPVGAQKLAGQQPE